MKLHRTWYSRREGSNPIMSYVASIIHFYYHVLCNIYHTFSLSCPLSIVYNIIKVFIESFFSFDSFCSHLSSSNQYLHLDWSQRSHSETSLCYVLQACFDSSRLNTEPYPCHQHNFLWLFGTYNRWPLATVLAASICSLVLAVISFLEFNQCHIFRYTINNSMLPLQIIIQS